MNSHQTRRLAVACGWTLALASMAQYRPPPLSEAQRLTYEGDDLRTDAQNLLAKNNDGDRKAAVEKYNHAIESYQKALAQDPNATAAAAGLGMAGNATKQYDLVIKSLGPVNAANPDALDVAYQLGIADYKMSKFEDAVPLLEKVSSSDNVEFLLSHVYLGQYYVRQGRGANAANELNKYLRVRPDAMRPTDSDIYYLLGNAYLLAKKPEYARTSFEHAQQTASRESIPIQLGLERVLEMQGKFKDAVAFLDALMQRNPQAPDPRERLGRVLIVTGDLKRAEQVASDLVRLKSTASAYLLQGDVRLAAKQGPQAEQALRKALELAPSSIPVEISLAKSLQMQGKSDQAISLLENAAQKGADTVDVWAVLGSVNRRAGHVQRAIEMHQRVLALAPNLAIGHVLIAADHFSTGQWDQAIDDYEKALKLDPEDLQIRHNLALALEHRARQRADSNRLDEAIPDLRRALDLDRTPGNARNLAAVLMSQHSYKDARLILDSAVKQPGATWRDHQLLGYASLGADDPRAAILSFEQAATQTKEADELSEIYAGWALAKLEVGEFDTAVGKLTEPGSSKRAGQVGAANLPIALLRRALGHLQTGDTAGAIKDYEAVKKLPVPRGEVAGLSAFVKALIDVEETRYSDGAASFKKLAAGNPRWLLPNARPLLDAYVNYRAGRFVEARKVLAQSQRKLTVAQAPWSLELSRAASRREGERAYVQNAMPQAERALKQALAGDASNPFVQHNLGCIKYRRNQTREAVSAWQKVEGQVAEASLNLGIDAQEKKHDPKRAIQYYRRYANSGGVRATLAREWKDRLQSLYGGSDTDEAPTAPVGQAEAQPQ